MDLQKFAQRVDDAGGMDNIVSISAAIEAAGGVQQFNSQLSQVTSLSSACGGPQHLAAHLQGAADLRACPHQHIETLNVASCILTLYSM